MKIVRFAAALLACAALSLSWAQAPSPKATSAGPDLTGIWYNPAESGWGVNFIQQNQTMFVTIFVYGANNQPLWLVGSDVSFASTDANGVATYTGTLYQTTGPYFGAPSFDPATVGLTTVGTVTVRFASPSSAQISYTVNNVPVTKSIIPQTFRNNNITGVYVGSSAPGVATPTCGLPLPAASGPTLVAYDISLSGTSATVQLQDQNLATCTLTGTIVANGKLTDINGTYTCTNGPGGQFAIRRLEAGIDGMSGTYFAVSNPNCATASVGIGGVRMP